jgi:AcrR family transcriptional regulator
MAKQPETTAATRRAFVDAFCSLYAHNPIEKITIQEITNKAGYNRSTFYQYFRDAYDLLENLEDEIIRNIKEAIEANLEQIDFADIFIHSFTSLQEETENYAGILLGNPNSTKFTLRAKDALLPSIIQHFGIPESDEKAIYVLDFYLAGIISVASHWLRDGRKVPPVDVGQLIHTLLTEGVLSALGRG